MSQRFGARSKYMQALKSLLQKNIPVAFGSDGPLNPFLNIMFAVVHPTNPAESITVAEAVIIYTYGSAFAEGKENVKGKLVKGHLADIAILSQDIFSIPVGTLPGTKSIMTIVGGKIVHDEGSFK
jgi:predicted amidohydrolase YtcJ